MDVKIRPAILKDLEDIKNLNYQLCKKEKEEFDHNIIADYSLSVEGNNYFKQKIIGKSNFSFVAIDNGKIVGYLAGGLIKSESYLKKCKLAELENMFVLDKYRGKKIGQKLIQEMFNWCKFNKVERIRVIASFQNTKAINFYMREGFKGYNLVLEKEL